MKAFLIVITGENSFPEGAVILKGSEKKEDQKGKYLMISLFASEKYLVKEFSGDQDQTIRTRKVCEEVEVNDKAWELAKQYDHATTHHNPGMNGDVIKMDLDEALGIKAHLHIYNGYMLAV